MKKIKYILFVICSFTFSVLGMAQGVKPISETMPEVPFQSTSSIACSGSTLPQAAITGVVIVEEENTGRPHGPHRVGGFGDNNAGDPGAVPVGDAVLPLALLAAAYVLFLARKKRAAN